MPVEPESHTPPEPEIQYLHHRTIVIVDPNANDGSRPETELGSTPETHTDPEVERAPVCFVADRIVGVHIPETRAHVEQFVARHVRIEHNPNFEPVVIEALIAERQFDRLVSA